MTASGGAVIKQEHQRETFDDLKIYSSVQWGKLGWYKGNHLGNGFLSSIIKVALGRISLTITVSRITCQLRSAQHGMCRQMGQGMGEATKLVASSSQ